MSASRPRLLILGLDGADPSLVERFAAEGACPNLARLIARGAWGPLASTAPPTSPVAWNSFLTGATPSNHGVPDFTIRQGYGVRFTGAGDRRLPTLLTHLERCGLATGAAWFPATYPPEPLSGWQIAGWDSPVTDRGDASFVHPPELHRDLTERFGHDHLAFDAVDEFSDDDDWYRDALESLCRRARRRAEMAAWLLAERPVDVAAFYFGETDTAAHHFWAFHDANSPRRPPRVEPWRSRALEQVYRAVDGAVGQLVDAVDQDCAVIVLSDHGSAGASDLALHLNRMLERAGLLAFRRRMPILDPTALRGAIPSLVPSRLRRGLFRLAGGILPRIAESRVRFGGIDWSRTRAFSEELTYSPSIWLNQAGREPQGMVRHRDRQQVVARVERAAAAVRAPDGRALIRRVIRREDIHEGPLVHLFPDLIVELEDLDGYRPVCLPSRGRAGDPLARLTGADLLGRKGRSLPGRHSEHGLLIVVAPAVSAGTSTSARIHDVTPIATALAGAPAAAWFEGCVPEGLLPGRDIERAEPACGVAPEPNRAYDRAEERVVAERLRRLGYLDW